MARGIDLNNQLTNLSLIKKQLNNKTSIKQIGLTKEVISTPRSDKETTSLTSSSAESMLNKETVIQLQQLQEFTIVQIQSKKDIDFNGVPRLSWLKGRDDVLYNKTIGILSRGANTMRTFSEIISITKDDTIISKEDWQTIKFSIKRFEGGLASYPEDRAKTNDPIVHKVLDYIKPKTQQRLNLLKEFLSTKIKAPDTGTTISEIFDAKFNIDTQTQINFSSEKTTELLAFLIKDLRWYEWYLRDEDLTSLNYFQLSLSRSVAYICS